MQKHYDKLFRKAEIDGIVGNLFEKKEMKYHQVKLYSQW